MSDTDTDGMIHLLHVLSKWQKIKLNEIPTQSDQGDIMFTYNSMTNDNPDCLKLLSIYIYICATKLTME